jgi:hypothetical protein
MAESTILRTEKLPKEGEDWNKSRWQKELYLYQAVDVVTQKEKKVLSLCRRR